MSEMIAPALSADEWLGHPVDVGVGLVKLYLDDDSTHATADTEALGYGPRYLRAIWKSARDEQTLSHMPAIIALANAALPDDDPRKLTRAKVGMLRVVADVLEALTHDTDVRAAGVERLMAVAYLRDHANALESYLPPEGA